MTVAASTEYNNESEINNSVEDMNTPRSSGGNDYYWENTGECLPKAVDYEDGI